jgi:hypothetical protein
VNSFTRYKGGDLFLPTGQNSGPARVGYLAPHGASLPDTFGLADALNTYAGWFILFPDLPTDPTVFVQQAQLYLTNAARAGALIAWFSNPDQAAQGLAALVLTAPRVAGKPVSVTRAALLQFANCALTFAPGTVVGVAADGDSLSFTAGATANGFSVTPMGQPKPVALPLTGAVTLAVTEDLATNGCFGFGLTLTDAAATALDVGLRMFTAPPTGGYAATARYPVFDLAPLSGGAPLTVTLDPLGPLDESRTVFAFASAGTALPSTYRTPVGGVLTLAPQPGAALVFSERLSAVDAKGKPIVTPGRRVLYMIPKGTFDLAPAVTNTAVATAPGGAPDLTANLMCGLSGVEYLSTAPGATLSFATGANAFASTLRMPVPATQDAGETARVFGPLTDTALTAWSYLSVPAGSTYFAQPDGAVMHQPSAAAPQSQLLQYAPQAVAQLPPLTGPLTETTADTATPFPMLPYPAAQAGVGLTPDDLAQFELQVVGPQRRRLMSAQTVQTPIPPAAKNATDSAATPSVTTPQGLLLTQTGSLWSQLLLAVSPSTAPLFRSQTLFLDDVTGDLRDALQSNQLFLVVTSGGALMTTAKLGYSLTAARLDILANVVKLDGLVITALTPLKDHTWTDEASFDAALQTALQGLYAANYKTILAYTADFSVFAADWEFDLSPWRWGDHNSILIFKFCTKRLDQLASDTSQWVHADAFNTSATAAQQQLRAILDDATKRFGAGDADLSYFVNTVMQDPQWNGILVLNAEVPMSGLPPQLEGLAAGIDASQFQAHHVGINITPVQSSGGVLTAKPSSVFGLIDYEDPTELTGTALDYQFKVNQLKVLIANSEIVGFSSVIELMINKLFGEPVQQVNALSNCLKLNGYYQNSGGVGSYTFVTPASTTYAVNSQVLNQVGIVQARFVTLTSSDPDVTTVNSRFNLSGSINFLNQAGFDLFSYGSESPTPPAGDIAPGLTYANLSIDMSFDVATPTYRTFAFDAQHILLDTTTSQARADSLASHFPMKLTGLYQAAGSVTPDSLGYMPVDSPLQGSQLSAPWFGLQYDLDLGTPGALAAQVGFTAGLLLAWSPNADAATVYVGLSLPGVSNGQRAISLQGVLTLAFGKVSFLVQPPTYILELGNIVLKFLSLSFPPGGQTSMVLFGNPNAQTSGALGWYASYVKTGAGQPSKASALKAGQSPVDLDRLGGPRS